MRVLCPNEECNWTGDDGEALAFKHGPPDYLICPDCGEHLESEAGAELPQDEGK